jgi:uncharacterized membrane protein
MPLFNKPVTRNPVTHNFYLQNKIFFIIGKTRIIASELVILLPVSVLSHKRHPNQRTKFQLQFTTE